MIAHSQSNGVLVEAYSPVAHGKILDHPALASMAQRYAVSVPQLSIRYCLELGLLPLPKTVNPRHMEANAAVDFSISAADMSELKAIEPIRDYGDAGLFPVFGGKLHADGTLTARK